MKYVQLLTIAICMVFASCGSDNTSAGNDTPAQETSKGEQLFNNYCLQCHSLDENKMGPKLRGSFAHWDNDTTRIRAFIRNAKETIESGDPRAVQVAKDWNNALMTPMPHLSDEDINHILEYIAE